MSQSDKNALSIPVSSFDLEPNPFEKSFAFSEDTNNNTTTTIHSNKTGFNVETSSNDSASSNTIRNIDHDLLVNSSSSTSTSIPISTNNKLHPIDKNLPTIHEVTSVTLQNSEDNIHPALNYPNQQKLSSTHNGTIINSIINVATPSPSILTMGDSKKLPPLVLSPYILQQDGSKYPSNNNGFLNPPLINSLNTGSITPLKPIVGTTTNNNNSNSNSNSNSKSNSNNSNNSNSNSSSNNSNINNNSKGNDNTNTNNSNNINANSIPPNMNMNANTNININTTTNNPKPLNSGKRSPGFSLNLSKTGVISGEVGRKPSASPTILNQLLNYHTLPSTSKILATLNSPNSTIDTNNITNTNTNTNTNDNVNPNININTVTTPTPTSILTNTNGVSATAANNNNNIETGPSSSSLNSHSLLNGVQLTPGLCTLLGLQSRSPSNSELIRSNPPTILNVTNHQGIPNTSNVSNIPNKSSIPNKSNTWSTVDNPVDSSIDHTIHTTIGNTIGSHTMENTTNHRIENITNDRIGDSTNNTTNKAINHMVPHPNDSDNENDSTTNNMRHAIHFLNNENTIKTNTNTNPNNNKISRTSSISTKRNSIDNNLRRRSDSTTSGSTVSNSRITVRGSSPTSTFPSAVTSTNALTSNVSQTNGVNQIKKVKRSNTPPDISHINTPKVRVKKRDRSSESPPFAKRERSSSSLSLASTAPTGITTATTATDFTFSKNFIPQERKIAFPQGIKAQRLKRKEVLERNRVAASKFRQKKKEYMKKLEDKLRVYEEEYENMSDALNQLCGFYPYDEISILPVGSTINATADTAPNSTSLLSSLEDSIENNNTPTALATLATIKKIVYETNFFQRQGRDLVLSRNIATTSDEGSGENQIEENNESPNTNNFDH